MDKVYIYNEKLKHARELRGWSQEELGRRVSCLAESMGHQGVVLDVSTISRWERGRNTPSPFYRQLLCTLFEQNAEELGLLSLDSLPTPVEEPPYLRESRLREAAIVSDNPSAPATHNLYLREPGAAELACNDRTLPVALAYSGALPDYARVEPTRQNSGAVEASTSGSTPRFFSVHRRKFLIALLTGATMGGGTALAVTLFQSRVKSSAPGGSVAVPRHWPEVVPDVHQTLARVRVIQWMLIARGWHLVVDGIFWVDTENAVMFFQENANLPVTTTVNGSTWERLIIPSKRAGDEQNMYRGSQVKALQEILNLHGASPRLDVDGEFGPLTEAATVHFQKAHQLPAHGQADLNTWCVLVGGHLG